MTLSSQLAAYALAAFNEKNPDSVTQIALQAIVGQYGLQIAGSEFSWSQSIYRYVMTYPNGAGESTVTRYGDSLAPAQAAFINSCLHTRKTLTIVIKLRKRIPAAW